MARAVNGVSWVDVEGILMGEAIRGGDDVLMVVDVEVGVGQRSGKEGCCKNDAGGGVDKQCYNSFAQLF